MDQPPPSLSNTGPSGPRRCCAAATRLFGEARRWLAFVEGRLPPAYAAQKALDSLGLSFRCTGGCPSRHEPRVSRETSGTLLVPTKLVGVALPERQAALRVLQGHPAGLVLRLARDAGSGRIAAIADGIGVLGYVQPKHGWLGPLVGRGAYAVFLQATGGTDRKPTLGANVALSGLDIAIRSVSKDRRGGPPPRPSAVSITSAA